MRFREVFRYELEHRVRSVSTWAYGAILFGLAFLLMSGGATPGSGVNADAPFQLAFLSIILGLFGLVVSAALFGDAAVRDVASGMDPLLFTSPLRKVDYLGGRYVAALATNAIVLLGVPLGLAMPPLLGFVDPAATFGPFRTAAYMEPWLYLLLPNLVFTGAVLFGIGVLARQVVPVFLGAIGLFVITMLALGPGGEGVHPVLSVLGPLGFHALNEWTEHWTAADKNARLIGLPSILMWNRVVWLAMAAAVLAALHRGFRFAHPDGGRRRRERRRPTEGTLARSVPVSVPRVAGAFGIRTTARQTLAVARRSLAEVVASRGFAAVLLACVGLPLLWGWNVGETAFDTSTWPVTLLVTEEVLAGRSVPLFYVLILVYAGELVWMDRESGAAEIVDAAPLPDGASLLGRFLALATMIATFLAAAMIGGLLIQALQGYFDFEIGLYLRVLFGLRLADYLFLGALAMAIHVVVNHKHLGQVAAVMALGLVPLGLRRLGIRHHLLLYGTGPDWTYSDMNGFGPFAGPLVWFRLYRAAWALLLLVLAALLWVRGREPGIRRRLRRARARFSGTVVRIAGAAVALILGLGGFVFYNTNILNAYRPASERGLREAEYEKRYGRYADLPQPTITAAELRVEIHPDRPALELRGAYRLVNRTDGAIDSVHVVLAPDLDARALSLDRPAEAVLADEEVGYRIYALERALEPGESIRLAFDVAFRPRGFPNDGIPTDVVANGTSFDRMRMPFIGYQPLFELSDDEARERFGLPPRPPLPGPEDAAALDHRWAFRDADLVQVDAVVGTAADQIAVAPGALRRSWTENGRRYFHYVTDRPVSLGGTVWSAKYAVVEDRWDDVALRIFHHPAHDANLDRMLRGMKASLEYLTEEFGPYPYEDLRIVEIPRYGGFGRAHPYTIAFTEDAFFSRVREGEVDQPFYGVAHEVAHAWWGGMVRGAPARGAAFLSESLANYSAMMVVEKTYGPEAARRVYDFQMERYLRGRATRSREVPLLEVEDQPYIAYRKGAIALYTLRERIGEAAVNRALRRFLESYRDAGPPYPTSLDLYAELRAVAPDSLNSLLTDWFETITLWDVRTERAVVEPTGTGEYLVTLHVAARKVRSDGGGNETEVPMDDRVEIGVFAPGRGGAPGEPIHLERHRIRSGERTIRVTVPRMPARAGIDPYRELIDRQRDDDDVEVEAAGESRRGGSMSGQRNVQTGPPPTNAARCSPVSVDLAATRSAGLPSNTTLPPSWPAPGPRSMIQSAWAITARWCSMTMTDFPASTSRSSNPSNGSRSAGCSPVVGSSST